MTTIWIFETADATMPKHIAVVVARDECTALKLARYRIGAELYQGTGIFIQQDAIQLNRLHYFSATAGNIAVAINVAPGSSSTSPVKE